MLFLFRLRGNRLELLGEEKILTLLEGCKQTAEYGPDRLPLTTLWERQFQIFNHVLPYKLLQDLHATACIRINSYLNAFR
ncbi:MAG: hypothetical protein OHK0021_06970 [Bryobacter sp.]